MSSSVESSLYRAASSTFEELGFMLVDRDPSERQLEDALGEVANVICGNLLPAIAGSTEIFRLDPPRPGVPVRHACSVGELVSTLVLGLDGGRAEVSLYATAAPTCALGPA